MIRLQRDVPWRHRDGIFDPAIHRGHSLAHGASSIGTRSAWHGGNAGNNAERNKTTETLFTAFCGIESRLKCAARLIGTPCTD
jgi:hypothetical protein